MLHRLCGPPSIPLSSHLRAYSPGGTLNVLTAAPEGSIPPAPSVHRLRLGLQGYLIPFAPLAFVPQRQLRPSKALSPQVFLVISTHFTATRLIPLTPTALKSASFQGCSAVRLRDLTPDLANHLRTLYAQ